MISITKLLTFTALFAFCVAVWYAILLLIEWVLK